MNRLTCLLMLPVLLINLLIYCALCIWQNGKRKQWERVPGELKQEWLSHWDAAKRLIEGVFR